MEESNGSNISNGSNDTIKDIEMKNQLLFADLHDWIDYLKTCHVSGTPLFTEADIINELKMKNDLIDNLILSIETYTLETRTRIMELGTRAMKAETKELNVKAAELEAKARELNLKAAEIEAKARNV
jgi:hypothetical protein